VSAGALALPGARRPLAAAPSDEEALRRRSRRALRPGVLLALFYAAALAGARIIDVSPDGKAMLLFGSTFSLALAFAAVSRPRWYLPLVLAYLPYSKVFPVSFGVTGANLTNLAMGLGLVAWLALRSGQGGRRVGRTEVLVALLVLSSIPAMRPSSAAGLSTVEMLLVWRAWVAPIVFFFLARALVRNREDVAGVLQVIAWTAILVALATWREGIGRSGRGSIEAARVNGLMGQPNSMGAFLAYYGVPLLACALTTRRFAARFAYAAGFLVAARAALFTFSRGAYLAYGAGAAAVLAVFNPLLLVGAGLAGGAGVVAFPSLLPGSVRERLADPPDTRIAGGARPAPTLDGSRAHRLVLWGGAVRMIAAHPLGGVGLGRFPHNIDRYAEFPLRRSDPRDAHNAFLLHASELGLPSLGLVLTLYLVWAGKALRLRRRRHWLDRRVGLALLGSLAAVLVSSMLGSRFSDEALVGYFWVLAALVVVVSRLRPLGERPSGRRPPSLRRPGATEAPGPSSPAPEAGRSGVVPA
jgi:O-antigen ligase